LNPRIEKLGNEIDKLKKKITEYQSRLRDLERQKTELENADIVAMVRDVDIPPDQFAEFVRLFKERQGVAVPDLTEKISTETDNTKVEE
jgi:predicted  nucleic acid-binding Zn-ribbon protein